MLVAKEQIRQIISENIIDSVADVYTLPRDSFKDILQEQLMKAEMEAPSDMKKTKKGIGRLQTKETDIPPRP